MNILMLTPYLPYPLHSGGQIRTYNLLKKLSTEHTITLVALIKDESEKEYMTDLEPFCENIYVFQRSKHPFTLRNILRTALSTYPFLVMRNYVTEVKPFLENILHQKNYDLIHAETFYMMPHLPKTLVPTLLVEQTIEWLGYESYAQRAPLLLKPFLYIDIAKIQHWEKYYWKLCSHLVVMSEDDKQFIATELGKKENIDVVENGIDTEWFEAKKRQEPKTPTILSVGTFKWLPNREAVQYLVKNVWPKIKSETPDSKLWIVGSAPTPDIFAYQETDENITVTGNIPDIRDAFTKSHVLLAPVFSGKGTRYKILEALASGTPVVATPVAVEGLQVEERKHVLIGTSDKKLAALTTELLNTPSLRAQLAKEGKKFVQKNYDWLLISRKLDIIYRNIARKKRADT
ncbi:MAG: glycosyltransferase family 4 protein [Patescibacteria group bacterium]